MKYYAAESFIAFSLQNSLTTGIFDCSWLRAFILKGLSKLLSFAVISILHLKRAFNQKFLVPVFFSHNKHLLIFCIVFFFEILMPLTFSAGLILMNWIGIHENSIFLLSKRKGLRRSSYTFFFLKTFFQKCLRGLDALQIRAKLHTSDVPLCTAKCLATERFF